MECSSSIGLVGRLAVTSQPLIDAVKSVTEPDLIEIRVELIAGPRGSRVAHIQLIIKNNTVIYFHAPAPVLHRRCTVSAQTSSSNTELAT